MGAADSVAWRRRRRCGC
ncbi:hypothetical protein [Neobacillus niacini]